MGKSAPTPPPAPDPAVIIGAQSQANTDTARLQAQLNNVNTYDPSGSVTYSQDPDNQDKWSRATTLAPDQQSIFDLSNNAQIGALGVANQQVGRVGDALAGGFDASGLPALATAPGVADIISTPGYGGQQSTFNPGQAVQEQIGPTDFTADREAVTDAVWNQARSRLDPMWNQSEDRLHTRLSNQGFSDNSQGATNAHGDFGRDRNDAYGMALFDAIKQGAEEQGRLFGESKAKGEFANDAAGQEFAQNAGQAQFANDATNADFQNKLAYSDFYNNAGQRKFDQELTADTFNNQARSQGLQEKAYQSQLPINELSALLGLGQVSMPSGIQYSPTQVNPTDAVGGYGVASNAATQRYAAQSAAQAAMNGSLFGGLAKLGSAAIGLSDIRLKRDIKRLGMLKGLGVYLFRYLWSDDWQVGVMAQEALKVRPDIVRVHPSGFLMVDYGAI